MLFQLLDERVCVCHEASDGNDELICQLMYPWLVSCLYRVALGLTSVGGNDAVLVRRHGEDGASVVRVRIKASLRGLAWVEGDIARMRNGRHLCQFGGKAERTRKQIIISLSVGY